MLSCFISTLFGFSNIDCLVDFFVDALGLHIRNLAVDIPLEILCLDTFPLISVEFDHFKSIADFLRFEFSVLAHSIETNYKGLFLSRWLLGNDLFPLTSVINVILIICFTIISTVSLFLLVFFLLFFLLELTLLDTESIFNAIIIGFHKETGVVFQADCQVRT